MKDFDWPASNPAHLRSSSDRAPAPQKPWERAGSSGPSPFRPSSSGASTATVVGSAGVANSGVKNENTNSPPDNATNVGRPMPPRPWERNQGSGFNSMTNYNQYSGYGTGSYGYSPYGGGSNYRGGFGSYGGGFGSYGGGLGSYGGMFGGGYGQGGTYGGLYGGGYGLGNNYGPMGGYGMGMGAPFGAGQEDPNNPFGGGPPAGPPTFWQSMLHILHGVMSFFGRLSILVDQNTQAFHFFITALLQLCDRAGLLYGELARFVLRLLGFRTKAKMQPKATPRALPGQEKAGNYFVEEPKEGGGAWENVWPDDNTV